MVNSKWNTGDTALVITVILFFITVYLIAVSYMDLHWPIYDLQKRIGALEQQCK